jgi:DNA-binding GntR family transcriptional regulator
MGATRLGVLIVTDMKPEPASSRAYSWTKERIIEGTFAIGTMLSEGEISEAVGVSRTPVREAFLRLAAEGLLDLFPKRGALVAPVTLADMRNVMEARLLIEPWAASVVAHLANREELVEGLVQLVSEMSAAQLPRDALHYRDTDRRFHGSIVAATDNSLIDAFYQSLRDRQLRVGFAALGHAEGRWERSHSEHRAIAAAIAEGDAELAAELVRAHVSNNQAALGLVLRVR